jgi:hypothetical protein
MKTPWFDKANNIWIDKEEYDNDNKEAIADVDAEIVAAKTALVSTPTNQEVMDFRTKINVEDDDMPF